MGDSYVADIVAIIGFDIGLGGYLLDPGKILIQYDYVRARGAGQEGNPIDAADRNVKHDKKQ